MGAVSTHSRTEAAAIRSGVKYKPLKCFNTQPHGGGCLGKMGILGSRYCFNTQPRGGGCITDAEKVFKAVAFQHTAARRRLPNDIFRINAMARVSTHSRAEAAAHFHAFFKLSYRVSTHSRAEAAAAAHIIKPSFC